MRARDHVTRARYFQIYYVAIIVDAYNFSKSFFWQEFSAILYHVFCRLPVLIHSENLNLGFEPNSRRELFLKVTVEVEFSEMSSCSMIMVLINVNNLSAMILH